MAGELRRRKLQDELAPPSEEALSGGAAVADKFERELAEEREQALERGLTVADFEACLARCAAGTKDCPRETERSNVSSSSSPSNSRCGLCCVRCVKALWISVLVCVFLVGFVTYCEPASFFLSRVMHTRVYDVVRHVRLGLTIFLPLLKSTGLDFWQGCMVENPFVNITNRCPCLHRNGAIVTTLEGGGLPSELLYDPRDIIIVRNATAGSNSGDTPDSTLRMLQEFYQAHREEDIAIVCSEDSIGVGGPHRHQQLFDRNTMKRLLSEKGQWSFVWEECPESHHASLRSLFPPPTLLPPGLFLHRNSLFFVSSQWAMAQHMRDLMTSPRVLVSVLHGEVRFVFTAIGDKCDLYCTELRDHPVLSRGDILLFDQRLWSFETLTWSKMSFTSVISVET